MIGVLIQLAQYLGSDMRLIETIDDTHFISGDRASYCKLWQISPTAGLRCVLDESMIVDECHYSTVWDVESDGEFFYAGLYSLPKIKHHDCAYVYKLDTQDVYQYPRGTHIHKLVRTPQNTILASVGDGPERSALRNIHNNVSLPGTGKNPTVLTYVGGKLLVGEDNGWSTDGSRIYLMHPRSEQLVVQLPVSADARSHLQVGDRLYISTIAEVNGVVSEIIEIDTTTLEVLQRYQYPHRLARIGAQWLTEQDGEIFFWDNYNHSLNSLSTLTPTL